MTADPLEFLRQAHARAETVVKALPRGPWTWTRYSDPKWCHTLEGPDGFSEAVLKSETQSPGVSWIELHPAFDEFLPDPAAVLRRIAAERALLDDLVAERHEVIEGDCWYTCAAATEEHDGGETCDDKRRGQPCDCGRDTRVQRRIRLIAESWGWDGNEEGSRHV